MVNWVPIQSQLDILRMDCQYLLRQVIKKTDDGKVYRSAKGDYLPFILEQHGLLLQIDEGFSADKPALFEVTRFGRKIVDNDHAIREVAMSYMNYLDGDMLDILQNDIFDWPYRDPVVAKFMQEMKATDKAPAHDDESYNGSVHADFFPQAPWYFHTVGKQNTPKKVRDKQAEQEYVKGSYTGVETSAWDLVHPETEVA